MPAAVDLSLAYKLEIDEKSHPGPPKLTNEPSYQFFFSHTDLKRFYRFL